MKNVPVCPRDQGKYWSEDIGWLLEEWRSWKVSTANPTFHGSTTLRFGRVSHHLHDKRDHFIQWVTIETYYLYNETNVKMILGDIGPAKEDKSFPVWTQGSRKYPVPLRRLRLDRLYNRGHTNARSCNMLTVPAAPISYTVWSYNMHMLIPLEHPRILFLSYRTVSQLRTRPSGMISSY